MDVLKSLVCNLLKNTDVLPCLQRINEAMLKDYQLSLGGYLSVLPLEVEIYYVNMGCIPSYVDTNMNCMIDSKMKEEIWQLQSARFGQLYYHLKGTGGIDICLSDSGDYALCCTLKAARINGEEVWGQLKVRDTIVKNICEHEHLSGEADLIKQRINDVHSQPVLVRREQSQGGYVYHVKRRVRRRDKPAMLPLRSFMDVWNKKLSFTNQQRISLYMQAHPSTSVMEVMRSHDFHTIPAEIRIKYHIARSEKL